MAQSNTIEIVKEGVEELNHGEVDTLTHLIAGWIFADLVQQQRAASLEPPKGQLKQASVEGKP